MGKIVWVFGASATGKKSWIFNTASTNSSPNKGRDLIGVGKNETVIPVIIPNRKSERRSKGNIERRTAKLLDIHRSNMDVVWLIHGQTIDINYSILETLEALVPGCLAECVFMNPRLHVYRERLGKRKLKIKAEAQLQMWWRNYYPELDELFRIIHTVE